LQTPLYVPENSRALKVLELFKQSGTHIALVTDEYGGVEGLVTLNDLLEALVGELPEAGEQDDPMSVQREDGSWLLDGFMSTDEFKDLFNKESLPNEEEEDYHTLAGFVIASLGHIPNTAEHFEWGGLRFEVVDMDGIRVDKVLVTPQPVPEDMSLDTKKYPDKSYE
ncbi:MAG: transporter associated domain-containing protein, partial [Microcoleaceae cyanobacterium]